MVTGFDKLEISLHLEIGDQDLFDRFSLLKKDMQGGFSKVEAVSFLRGEYFVWNMQRLGTKFFPYVFKSGDVTLMLSSRNPDSRIPNCQIEIGSVSCQSGIKKIYQELTNFLKIHKFEVKKEVVTRVDLAADFIGVEHAALELDNRNRWISRARNFDRYDKEWENTGVALGRGGVLMMRIYNKSLELKRNKAKSDFFHRLWGCKKGTPVTRVEFQLRREVLKEFVIPVHTVKDLFQNADSVWKYCTQDWARFTCTDVDRKNDNQDRAVTHVFWKMVQDANFIIPVKGYLKNRRYQENLHKNIHALIEQARGCMMSIAAAAGHDVNDFFGILATVGDTLQQSMADFMTDRKAEFIKLFNTRLNECYVGF